MPLWNSRIENEQINEQCGNNVKNPLRFHSFTKGSFFFHATFDQESGEITRMHTAWRPFSFELTTHCGCHGFASKETNNMTKSGGLSVVPCGTTVRVKTKAVGGRKKKTGQTNIQKCCRTEKHFGGISSFVKNDQRI